VRRVGPVSACPVVRRLACGLLDPGSSPRRLMTQRSNVAHRAERRPAAYTGHTGAVPRHQRHLCASPRLHTHGSARRGHARKRLHATMHSPQATGQPPLSAARKFRGCLSGRLKKTGASSQDPARFTPTYGTHNTTSTHARISRFVVRSWARPPPLSTRRGAQAPSAAPSHPRCCTRSPSYRPSSVCLQRSIAAAEVGCPPSPPPAP